jgi:hypothetical protein
MNGYVSCALLAAVLLLATNSWAGIGIFEDTANIPSGGVSGATESVGMVDGGGTLAEQYLVTGGGAGIQGSSDEFHFAYRTLSGDWRISADFQWAVNPPDAGARMGVMVRASTAADSVQYDTMVSDTATTANDGTYVQWRATAGGDSSEEYVNGRTASRLGIQRVYINGEIPAIESIADFGAGWERVGSLKIGSDLPDEALFGLCVTSHSTRDTATARVTDVVYERAQMVGTAPAVTLIPAGSARETAPTGPHGFVVRTVNAPFTEDWGRVEMDRLLDFGYSSRGVSVAGINERSREVPFVNLYDSGDRGVFSVGNGYRDETFPVIDSFESPAESPAGGDDDDYFVTEVLAVIHLAPGLHVIGVNDDEGTVVEVGGVEIGRTPEWKEVSTTDFIFEVRQAGFYTLRARHLEGSGGAALELHEIVQTASGAWKRILLGDVAGGGSPVYVPEPATIVLLGLGMLAFVRRGKK